MNRWILVASLLTALASAAAPEMATPTWPPAEPAAIAKWQAKRFGMFIHFGPVSLTGKEIGWSRGAETPIEIYDNLYKRFNPSNFNAEAWVTLAHAAGMKYIVLTAKHHDGFCLWDTKFSDYSIMKTPFHRDLVAELAAACKRHGMPFGTYYSTCDWWHPDFPLTSPGGTVKREKSDLDAYNRYLLSQVGELITKYGPLLTIWNDVPQHFEGRGAQTIKLARSLQPDILINNRTGDGGDYDTPEQRVGKYQDNRPWETCMTLCEQWSWKPNDKMKSLEQCVLALVRCAGSDGNLLFNVGPMPTGEIEPRQIDRLKEIGDWLDKNGGSIYSTRAGPWKPNRSIASTRKDHTVYLHILNGKADSVELPDIPRKVLSAALLNGDQIQFLQEKGKLSLNVPIAKSQPIETIVKLELNGSAMNLPAQEIPSAVRATASTIYRNQTAEYGPQLAFDGDPDTRWATDAGTSQAWIAVNFSSSRTFQSVTIRETYDRVRKFEFQYRDGDNWKTIFAGTALGERFRQRFGPVTAREFRLNILEAMDGPTISEIELSY